MTLQYKKVLQNLIFRLSSFGILFFGMLFLIFILFPQDVYPIDLTLVWNDISEENFAGYRIFYREEGQSYNYAESIWEGIETTCTINNLDETITYYFVARAFNLSGFETNNSNEVRYPPTEANSLNSNEKGAGGGGGGCFIATTASEIFR